MLCYGIYLSYGVFLWGDSVYHKRIFIAQKKIIRLIFGLKSYESCKLFFKIYKILTAPCIYIYKCLLLFKINEHEICKHEQLHGYNTHFGYLHVLDHHRMTKYERFPHYIGTKFFNKLPKELQILPYVRFKSRIKKLLLIKCYCVSEYFNDKFYFLFFFL